jgi:hypothetical protein
MRSDLEISDQTRDLQEYRESPKERRGRRGLLGRLRPWAASLLLLSLVCLIIVGPLRGFFAPVPGLLFLASFALFIVPGAGHPP